MTAAIFSEVVGTHATLGAFLAGVALGRIPRCAQAGARKLLPHHRQHLRHHVFCLHRVEGQLRGQLRPAGWSLFVLLVACVGKISGVFLGARLGGKQPNDALIVALGMNARGAVGIVLTTVALEYGLIDQRIFVALIIMALATSVLSSVGIKHLLGPAQPKEEVELLPYV